MPQTNEHANPPHRRPTQPPLRWAVFCHVVDNWGDVGVSWRLCQQLASAQQQVDYYLGPDAQAHTIQARLAGDWHHPNIRMHAWPTTANPPQNDPLADVWVACFDAELPIHWISAQRALLRSTPPTSPTPPVWINLEYLSAESYVERSHGLPSPQFQGAAAGLTRWFFYPGFTPKTGGLLREHHLFPTLAAEINAEALHPNQLDFATATTTHQSASSPPRISLFCYEPPDLCSLVQYAASGHTHWLVTSGRSQQAWQNATAQAPTPIVSHEQLPWLSQSAYDLLLHQCALNFVRGEDSLVRALWAGKAFIWQIYPQDDLAHHAKLNAFLDWLDAPADLRQAYWHWNLGANNQYQTVDPKPLQNALRNGPPAHWQTCILNARERLLQQPDLLSQLLTFVEQHRINTGIDSMHSPLT